MVLYGNPNIHPKSVHTFPKSFVSILFPIGDYRLKMFNVNEIVLPYMVLRIVPIFPKSLVSKWFPRPQDRPGRPEAIKKKYGNNMKK